MSGASRILITGAAGQLGRSLQRVLADSEVIALTHADLDITDREAVLATIGEARPETVINAAAWTDTAGCEKDPEQARNANGRAPSYIAEACGRIGASLVHISSNEVFDGEKGVAYTESDDPNPLNEYGRSKLLGEEAVATNLDRHQIVRTSWLYGPGRVSFPEKILERARADGRLRLVTDEIASPTSTEDLAEAIAALLTHDVYGVFHLVNEGECSRKTWAEETLRQCGLDVPIEETTQAEFNLPFRKPVLSTLANTRAAALGVRLRRWDEALAGHLQATGAAVQATRA